MLDSLTPGQQKFERERAMKFLMTEKPEDRNVNWILKNVGSQFLVELLAEYHTSERVQS